MAEGGNAMSDQPMQAAVQKPADPWAVPAVIVGIIAIGGAWWVFTGTATVYLQNNSFGNSVFYVDGIRACNAGAGTRCTVLVHTWKAHEFSATTFYGGSVYTTPPASLAP